MAANCCDGYNKQTPQCVLEDCVIINPTIIGGRASDLEIDGDGPAIKGIVTNLKIDNRTKVMTWEVDGKPFSYDLAEEIAQDTFVTSSTLDGSDLVLLRNDGVELRTDLSSLGGLPEFDAGNALERLAISEEGEVVWMRTNLPSLVYKDLQTQIVLPERAHGRLVHIDPGPTEVVLIGHGGGQDELFYIVNRTTRTLIVRGVSGVGMNAVADAVKAPNNGYILKDYGTIAVRTSVNNAKIWGDVQLESEFGEAPNFTVLRTRDGANADPEFRPDTYNHYTIGNANTLQTENYLQHKAFYVNRTSGLVLPPTPTNAAGGVIWLHNVSTEPLPLIPATGLTLRVPENAQAVVLPGGTARVYTNHLGVAFLSGDLESTGGELPDLSTGEYLDRLIIDESGVPQWTPMMLPGVVTPTNTATVTVNPITSRGRLVHVNPGSVKTVLIGPGENDGDWFYLVNRTAGDLTIRGAAGVGLNNVVTAAPAAGGGVTLKRFGTIAARCTPTNAKIWGDLVEAAQLPPAGPVPSALVTDLDGVAKWTTGFTKVRSVLTARYGATAEDGPDFGWQNMMPEFTTGVNSSLTNLVVDPVSENIGFPHFMTHPTTTGIRIDNQPAGDSYLTFITNTTDQDLPITFGENTPPPVTAVGAQPSLKAGGSATILFDNRVPASRNLIIWGDLSSDNPEVSLCKTLRTDAPGAQNNVKVDFDPSTTQTPAHCGDMYVLPQGTEGVLFAQIDTWPVGSWVEVVNDTGSTVNLLNSVSDGWTGEQRSIPPVTGIPTLATGESVIATVVKPGVISYRRGN